MLTFRFIARKALRSRTKKLKKPNIVLFSRWRISTLWFCSAIVISLFNEFISLWGWTFRPVFLLSLLVFTPSQYKFTRTRTMMIRETFIVSLSSINKKTTIICFLTFSKQIHISIAKILRNSNDLKRSKTSVGWRQFWSARLRAAFRVDIWDKHIMYNPHEWLPLTSTYHRNFFALRGKPFLFDIFDWLANVIRKRNVG